MRHFHKIWLALLGLAAGGTAQAQAPALATFPVGSTTVTVSQLSAGLNVVWGLAWGPDNFLWMTERTGRISRINPATGQVLPLLTLPDVTLYGEGGLLGMALHPQFATSPYLYVVYNYTNPAGQFKEKVVRYTYSATANSLSNPTVLLGEIGAGIFHNGSRIIILPDMTLLVTTGDANVSATAQNMASLNGKTLRMNLDGTIPANNPFPGSYIYTSGHRNPQGLVQLPSGRIFSSEHGPANDDEINRIEAGRNYGWPNVEGYCNLPAEMSFCSANNVREPLTTWTPTVAPSGLEYYNHPAIPGWQGSLLLACLNGNRLIQMPLSAGEDAILARNSFLTTFGRLRAICISPQGKVYIGTSANNASQTNQVLTLENRAYMASATQAETAFRFQLWPNPARQQARLELPAPNLYITVRDMLGRTVQAQRAPTTSVTLDLSGLRPGSYIVEASGPAGAATRHLLVE